MGDELLCAVGERFRPPAAPATRSRACGDEFLVIVEAWVTRAPPAMSLARHSALDAE
ncbi:MAG: hypothetical protein IPK27_14995 [Rhodanobacteraceae bacterium]|nr:hypothetical protein [Rhodanobacteraceae bacterium]